MLYSWLPVRFFFPHVQETTLIKLGRLVQRKQSMLNQMNILRRLITGGITFILKMVFCMEAVDIPMDSWGWER